MNRRTFFKRIAQVVAVAPVAGPIIAKASERPWAPKLTEAQCRVLPEYVSCGSVSRASITPLSQAEIQRLFVCSVFFGKPMPQGLPRHNLETMLSYRSPSIENHRRQLDLAS